MKLDGAVHKGISACKGNGVRLIILKNIYVFLADYMVINKFTPI